MSAISLIRVVARLALAGAIIVGILTMHSFLTVGSQAHPAAPSRHSVLSTQLAASTVPHHVVALAVSPEPDEADVVLDCAACAGGMSMAAMLCTMALLSAALMLGAPGLRGRRHRPFLLLVHRAFSASARYGADSVPPPSLIALGISRT